MFQSEDKKRKEKKNRLNIEKYIYFYEQEEHSFNMANFFPYLKRFIVLRSIHINVTYIATKYQRFSRFCRYIIYNFIPYTFFIIPFFTVKLFL